MLVHEHRLGFHGLDFLRRLHRARHEAIERYHFFLKIARNIADLVCHLSCHPWRNEGEEHDCQRDRERRNRHPEESRRRLHVEVVNKQPDRDAECHYLQDRVETDLAQGHRRFDGKLIHHRIELAGFVGVIKFWRLPKQAREELAAQFVGEREIEFGRDRPHRKAHGQHG